MTFKDFYLLREATVLPGYRKRFPSAHHTFPPLKDDATIRVYHGFNRISDIFQTLKQGISGQERAPRIYSYEFNNNPKGLFVTISLNVAKDFGNYIIEFHTKVSDLESPVWPGGSFTVQGGYSSNFDSEEEREEQRLVTRQTAYKSKNPSVQESDRPELADILYNSSEQQALFIGNLNPNCVRAVWVNPDPSKTSSVMTYKRMRVAEFLKTHADEDTVKSQHSRRVLQPRDKFTMEKFMDKMVSNMKDYDMGYEKIIDGLLRMEKRNLLVYLWPHQVEDAWKAIQELKNQSK